MCNFRAIDIHAHFGSVDNFPVGDSVKKYYNIDIEKLKEDYTKCGIEATIVSALDGIFVNSEKDLLKSNERLFNIAANHEMIYQWVIINPLMKESFHQAKELMRESKCLGIKIHPDAHGYEIGDFGDEIFSFCSENGFSILSHGGGEKSLPENFITFADKYANVNLIIAHLGNSPVNDPAHHIKAVKASKKDNVFIDISSENSLLNGIIEDAVEKIGDERILFGTDAPLHNIPMMHARLLYGDVKEESKKKIFYENAEKLLF